MKSTASLARVNKNPNHHLHIKNREKFQSFAFINTTSLVLYLTCVAIPLSFYCLFSYYYYNPQNNTTTTYTATNNGDPRRVHDHQIHQTKVVFVPPPNNDDGGSRSSSSESSTTCDLFKGQWIRDLRDTLYTNYSCTTIPFLKNCFLHGRKDTDFLHWRWKPDQCELPRFRPREFLDTVEGKTMAFVGDSLARNHMESLLCLLSTVETPKLLYKDSEDRFLTWEFPPHNFTLTVLWSQFLVTATDRLINGSTTGNFNLHLDRIDKNWSTKLQLMDYVIFSDAHWFFRQHNVYENNSLTGCIYCDSPNQIKPGVALRKAFRAALKEVNNCKDCKKLHVMVRTFSPAHFENGAWNAGGGCNRTWPIKRDEVDKDWSDWEYMKIQIEEIENARSEGVRRGNVFDVIDVTEMMLLRSDGHPGLYWGNQWMKGYSDCIHWCMPGPVDTWNELMFELIKRHRGTVA